LKGHRGMITMRAFGIVNSNHHHRSNAEPSKDRLP
jgi:hypothetical protein